MSFDLANLKVFQRRLFLLSLHLTLTLNLFAQSGEVSSGGDVKGEEGSVSYSVGQVVFSPLNNNEVIPGLQQAYLILPLVDQDEIISVYPNPSFGKVTLEIKDQKLTNYSFQVANIWGHSLIKEQVVNRETSLVLEPFANAMYFIKVFRKGREVKVFKIIKSQ